MTAAARPVALASLSALHVRPPELVHLAAEAGFDMMGALRLNPASDGSGHDLLGDARLRRRTAAALADTALPVLDVEVFRVRVGSRPQDAEPLLAVGAELGAGFLLCAVEDPDQGRRAAAFADVCRLAASYGLRCVVEPMVFSAVRTPQEAAALIEASGTEAAGVLVDALHLARAGGTPRDLDHLDARLLPYLQVCDAAVAGPAVDRAAAVAEAVGRRLPPGDGVLPLSALLRRLPPGAPISVEAPNPVARDDPRGWVRRLAAAAQRLLSAPTPTPS